MGAHAQLHANSASGGERRPRANRAPSAIPRDAHRSQPTQPTQTLRGKGEEREIGVAGWGRAAGSRRIPRTCLVECGLAAEKLACLTTNKRVVTTFPDLITAGEDAHTERRYTHLTAEHAHQAVGAVEEQGSVLLVCLHHESRRTRNKTRPGGWTASRVCPSNTHTQRLALLRRPGASIAFTEALRTRLHALEGFTLGAPFTPPLKRKSLGGKQGTALGRSQTHGKRRARRRTTLLFGRKQKIKVRAPDTDSRGKGKTQGTTTQMRA